MVRVTLASLAALALLAGCKTDNVTDGVKSAGSAVVDGAKDVAGAGVSLVNVDLSNVLNDLALDLKIDKSNIPINAQIPINVAANICGVSINVLSIGGSLLPHSLSYGVDQVEPGGRIILMKDHYNTPERDRIVRINDGLAHTGSVHERSTG